ncbi:MAG: TIGR01212 family radical SAM protein [Bacteroidota bacterium]
MYLWNHNRRFNDYSSYLSSIFGGRIQKLTIDAGFSCPNRDGSISVGGCTFCVNDAFNPSYCASSKSITQQLIEGIEFHNRRYRRAVGYLAYFQAFSNTYSNVDDLRAKYYEALSIDGVKGLIIGTRPDCISTEILDLIEEINQKYYVVVEFGIESCFDDTLEKINRGHSFQTAENTLKELEKRNIKTGAHFIFGLPDESISKMMSYAPIISELPIKTVKFHQLQIFKNTIIAEQYKENPSRFKMFELDEYIAFIINFIEQLNPNIVIERFAGEAPPRFLDVSTWGLMRYDKVLSLIEKKMEERNTWQGKLCQNTH